MTKRVWLLVATAYALGALGLLIALAMIENGQDSLRDTNNRLERQNEKLAAAAGAYCLAGLQDDRGERQVIHQLAAGRYPALPKSCREIVARIEAP